LILSQETAFMLSLNEIAEASPQELAKACADRLRKAREAESDKVASWGFQRGRQWAAFEASEYQLDGLNDYRLELEKQYGCDEIEQIIRESKDPHIIENIGRRAGLVNMTDPEEELRAFFGDFADDRAYVAAFVDAALVVLLDAWDLL
jgi:hypothetical protein